jgi:hypothetical protein
MPKEYKTHDGWKRACERLLTQTYTELGVTHDELLYWQITGETKKDLREFQISPIPFDQLPASGESWRFRGFYAIAEWDGEKGELYEDARKRIAGSVRERKLNIIAKGTKRTKPEKIEKDRDATAAIGSMWRYQIFLKQHAMEKANEGTFLEACRWMMTLDTGYDLRYIHKNEFSVGYYECNHDDIQGWQEVGRIWK